MKASLRGGRARKAQLILETAVRAGQGGSGAAEAEHREALGEAELARDLRPESRASKLLNRYGSVISRSLFPSGKFSIWSGGEHW